MFNYDKLSCIFSCLLLTRNHMIFLVQCGINKHLLIFFKDHKLHSDYGLVQFCWSLKKIYSCLFSPHCTRNHVITYTNCTPLSSTTIINTLSSIANQTASLPLAMRFYVKPSNKVYEFFRDVTHTYFKRILN